MSDTFAFRGVNPETGSPYTKEELKARDAKRQLPLDRLYEASKNEVFMKIVGGMSHIQAERQALALYQAGWDPHVLIAPYEEIVANETARHNAEEKQNQLKAAETQATLNSPLNVFSKAFKYRNTLPSFRLRLQAWIEQQTKDTLQSVYEDLAKGKLPNSVIFVPEDTDNALTFLGVCINQKKTSEPEKKSLLSHLHL